ncbi:MAG: ABC transporter permease [Thermoanaerobaculia bacterium]
MTTTTLAEVPPRNVTERRIVGGAPLSLRRELHDLVRNSSLLYELVHRDLTVRYKRSLLGFLWTMLHPLLLMLIFLVVFSHLFRFETPHYETYFLSAYVAWNFFSQTLLNSMMGIAWNGPLMKRVRVPPSIFTIASTVSGLVNLGLSLVVLFGIMLFVGVPVTPSMAFLPVALLIVGVFTLGVSLALTAISVFFGDVGEMVQAGMPALMYLTPVIYPVTIVPDRYRWFIKLNPLTYIVEIVRDPVYYGIIPTPATLSLSIIFAVGALVIGWLVFRYAAPRFHAHL